MLWSLLIRTSKELVFTANCIVALGGDSHGHLTHESLARSHARELPRIFCHNYTHLVEHLAKWFLVVHQSATKTWKMDGVNSSSHCPNTLFFLRKMKWRRMHLYMRDVNDDSLATSEGTSENLFSTSFTRCQATTIYTLSFALTSFLLHESFSRRKKKYIHINICYGRI